MPVNALESEPMAGALLELVLERQVSLEGAPVFERQLIGHRLQALPAVDRLWIGKHLA